MRLKKALFLPALALVLSTGWQSSSSLFEYAKNLEIFNQLFKELGDQYVDEIPSGQLIKTGIDAMLAKLDPYTNFFSEFQAEEALMERQGEYGGVGCRTQIREDGYHVVSEVFPGYAFWNADIRCGDKLLKLGEIDLQNVSSEELRGFLRGAPGSQFSLSIAREGRTYSKQVSRASVQTQSSSYSGLVPASVTGKRVAYIKLDEFGAKAAAEVGDRLKALQAKGHLDGLLLDLRGNGGGLLNEAVAIVGHFVGPDVVIVTLKGRNYKGPTEWRSPGQAIAPSLPLVVLIDDHSASASEVVSGALQDLDRAVIAGQNSFGKGLVQNYVNLPYRTQMKLTTARYHTPSGRCIQKLDYGHRDADGKATTKEADQIQSFKTRNGRVVYEAGGVKPDALFDPLAGSEILKKLQDQHLLFDWATQEQNRYWGPETRSSAFDSAAVMRHCDPDRLWSSLLDYVQSNAYTRFKTESSKALQSIGWKEADWKLYGGQWPSASQYTGAVIAAMNASKKAIVQEAQLDLLKRLMPATPFSATALALDPEIAESSAIVTTPERYQRFLVP